MFESFFRIRRLTLAVVFAAITTPVVGDYHSDPSADSSWAGEFPPEDYNPYMPDNQRPVQQLPAPLQSPFYPQSPILSRGTAPTAPPLAPAVPRPGYYSPRALPLPGGSYPPPVYAPDPGLYPGYFYPFNNGQFFAPFF